MTFDTRENIPIIIGAEPVVLYSRIDARHSPRDSSAALPYGLAICRQTDGPGYFLFTCEDDWMPLFDSWHETLDLAKSQAEFKFHGISATWEVPPDAPDF